MAEGRLELRKEDLQNLMPWTKLFKAFMVALDIKKLLLAAGGIVTMALGWWLLAFLFYFAWQAKDELATILSEASLLLLVLASLAWCLFNVVTPLLAVTLLNACGSKIGLWQAFAIHASRLPARYARRQEGIGQ